MRQVIRVIKTPVTLIILLAMLGYGAMWGYQHVTMPDNRRVDTCVLTDVGENLTPDRVTVRVLNGGETGGLAKITALFLRGHGFRVIYYNNSDERVPNTVVVGNSVDDPEVKLMLGFFTGSTAKGDGRADHVVDVILGDKDTHIEAPVASVPVTGPVCLPAIASSTVTPIPSPTPSNTKKK
ncbi:MAG TPA: LytR C-terminal domain-containing protein [Propionicimonas sp.]|uniref:LytR C-terminal domain-containing protein n=1 Tax=Propionicimonas sp. TaxID=1955623 RepID=UPI002F401F51